MKCGNWTDQHDTSLTGIEHRAGALPTEQQEFVESKVISLSIRSMQGVGIREVMGSIPVVDSDFSLSHTHVIARG